MPFEVIHAPHANVNDLELTLTRWLVSPWDKVAKGQAICELETTKATIELGSEFTGFLYPAVNERDVVKVGEPVAYVFPTADPAQIAAVAANPTKNTTMIVSAKARALMAEFGLTEADFPRHTSIGSDTVIAKIRERRGRNGGPEPSIVHATIPQFTANDLVIYGELNLATLVWDALANRPDSPSRVVGFIPTDDMPKSFFNLPLFAESQLSEMAAKGLSRVFPCAASRQKCEQQAARLKSLNLVVPSVVHQSATVSCAAKLGIGVFVGAGAAIGPEVEIGDFTKVLSGATVAHHSRVGRFVAISDGAHIGGNVQIDDGALIGIGAAVNKRVHIGANALVVSGAAVVDHVPARHIHRRDGSVVPKR